MVTRLDAQRGLRGLALRAALVGRRLLQVEVERRQPALDVEVLEEQPVANALDEL